MKATGIVRRIDDLGRVVVPKEIRRTLRIREGDPLEIFTDKDGEIILKKYSPIGELGIFAQQYADSVAIIGTTICICDRDQIIAVGGNGKKELMGKNLNKEMEEIINERKSFIAHKGEKNFVKICGDNDDLVGEVIQTIICEGDAIGAVIIMDKEGKTKLSELEQKIAAIAAAFLGRQMEN